MKKIMMLVGTLLIIFLTNYTPIKSAPILYKTHVTIKLPWFWTIEIEKTWQGNHTEKLCAKGTPIDCEWTVTIGVGMISNAEEGEGDVEFDIDKPIQAEIGIWYHPEPSNEGDIVEFEDTFIQPTGDLTFTMYIPSQTAHYVAGLGGYSFYYFKQ